MSSFPNNVNSAKHREQGEILFCSLSGVWWLNSITFHLIAIILVSRSSDTLNLPAYVIRDLLDAKIGVLFTIMTSDENWFFGEGNFMVSPSNKRSKSFQGIISRLHRKSCKRITSAESAPTHAYLSLAGLFTQIFVFPISNITYINTENVLYFLNNTCLQF